MKHRILVAMVIGLAITSPLSAQRAQTTAAITAADLRQRLFRIADDSMKGRDTGSPEDSMTADYVAAEFKRLGLRPAGEHGGWFQTVPFFVAAPSATSLTVRDGTLKSRTDFVVTGRPTSAPAAAEFTAVYGGFVGDTSTWISEADAAGKVVVLDLKPVNGATPAFSNALFNNPRFARARGVAIAALGVVSPAQQANFMRAPRPVLDTTRGPARPFQMLVTPAAAVKLMASSPVQGDPSLHWVPIAHLARNVVGIVPGSDAKLRATYVSLTAHNDHVGICSAPVDHDSLRAFNRVFRPMGADTRTFIVTTDSAIRLRRQLQDSLRAIRPARPDSICNGADDDGSGTVSILELAEYFAGLPQAQRPKRSMLFVSHVAEEVGLVGSQWYTDHPTVPIDSIVAEIDMDMVGRGGATDLPGGGPTYLEVVGLRRLSNEFGDLMEEANKAQKLPFVFNYEFDVPGHPLQYYCRADHYNYARYGIPSWSISRGEHLDYHQVTDEPQYIDYDSMLRVVTLVRDGAIKVGNLDHAPKLDKPKQTDPHVRCVQ